MRSLSRAFLKPHVELIHRSFSRHSRSSITAFDREVKRQQRANAARLENSKEYDYLRNEVADRLVDRLNDIQKSFPLALDLGCGAGHIYNSLIQVPNCNGIETLIQCDHSEEMLTRDTLELSDKLKTYRVVADEENLPFQRNQFDLVMSSLTLHWVNNIGSSLSQILGSLKPDGVFIGAVLGGGTLQELRSSLILAEEEREGGISPHISPFPDVADVGNALQQAGYALPTVDTDYIEIEYPNAFVLMEHLQNMGENNANVSRRNLVSRETFLSAASIYQHLYSNGENDSVRATFQVIYMIGWAPDRSQPKPLARGSAKQSLKSLSVVEDK